MTLSAVLVPCDPLSSGSDVSTTAIDQPMCIWIGQIEVSNILIFLKLCMGNIHDKSVPFNPKKKRIFANY